MMRTWSFHHKDTGLFNGSTYSCDNDKTPIAANTPPDHIAVAGVYDHLSQRVDLATGKVVDYQPPQPSPDHEWNAETRRWQLTAAAAAKGIAAETARAKIKQLEASQHRAVREALLGDQAALKRLASIDFEIKTLRSQLL